MLLGNSVSWLKMYKNILFLSYGHIFLQNDYLNLSHMRYYVFNKSTDGILLGPKMIPLG